MQRYFCTYINSTDSKRYSNVNCSSLSVRFVIMLYRIQMYVVVSNSRSCLRSSTNVSTRFI